MISPSSLEGISYALESGRILAEILNQENKNISFKYYVKTYKIRIKLFLKILKKPFMYNKFLRNIVMRTGINSLKINKAAISK